MGRLSLEQSWNYILPRSTQLSHQCVFFPGDVATAMLNRAKNDFAVYFDSIKDGSSTSTPIATTANSEHLQHCYGSDTCGWSWRLGNVCVACGVGNVQLSVTSSMHLRLLIGHNQTVSSVFIHPSTHTQPHTYIIFSPHWWYGSCDNDVIRACTYMHCWTILYIFVIFRYVEIVNI